jgi:hypothetical protein
MMAVGVVIAVHLCRQTRDAGGSASVYYRKMRSRGQVHSLARIGDTRAAITLANGLLDTWADWRAHRDQVLIVRYEDLLAKAERELERPKCYLCLEVSRQDVGQIPRAPSPGGLDGC